MKKLFIMAMLVVSTATAFAQDALKTILKSKDYSEAKSLLTSNLSTLTAEQKAKAYNKLVELSMVKVKKEKDIMSANQLAKQFGQGKEEPVDNAGMYAALANALKDAMECDKYDNMPNDKGKVAPKYHKSNQTKLWLDRVHLISAGQDASDKNDNKTAFENYALYVESGVAPLFADMDKSSAPDTYLSEVARVAGVIAYQDKDYDTANKYIDVALGDTATYKDALSLKMLVMQQQMKTHEDSVKCLTEFEKLYAKDSNNETIFTNLATIYGQLGMKDKQAAFIQQRLTAMPNDFMAHAVKGQAEMNESKWDEAIVDFKKAAAVKDDPLVLTWLGFCLTNKAAGLANVADQKPLVEETKDCLEKARQLDPNQERANWRYLLYSTYYNLYGENDARTKELAQ